MRLFGFDVTRSQGQRRMPNLASTVFGSWGLPHPLNFAAQIKMYRSWVYICAAKNAKSVAAVPLRLYTTTSKKAKLLFSAKSVSPQRKKYLQANSGLTTSLSKGDVVVEVLDHPFLDLMKNVNNFNNQFETQELLELFLELTGNAYLYPAKNNLGIPYEMWVIPPQYMTIIPDKDKFVKGYIYRRGLEEILYDESEIIHFKFANPESAFYGMGPTAAIWGAHKFNMDIREFENSLLENRGVVEGALETDARVNDAEFKRIKDDWRESHQGKSKVGKTAFLDNGIKYKPHGNTPKDITYPVGQKRAIEEIAAAFGVPMSKLTTEAVNMANAMAGETQYQRDTIVPRLRIIEQKNNEKILPMYDDRLFVAFDDPVPENQDMKLKEMQANLGSYVTTINEERESLGMESVSWGDLPLVPINLVPYGTPSAKEIDVFTDMVLQKIREA